MTARKYMELGQAFTYIQSNNLFLHYTDGPPGVDLWTPNTPPVPITLRRSVHKHREQLQRLMTAGAADVCPSREHHRQFWKYQGNGKYSCEKCRHFVYWGIC